MCHNKFIILYIIILYIITHIHQHNYNTYNIHIDSINININNNNIQTITEPNHHNEIITNFEHEDEHEDEHEHGCSLHEYDYILPPSPDTLHRFKPLPSLPSLPVPPPVPDNHPPLHPHLLQDKKKKIKIKKWFKCCK